MVKLTEHALNHIALKALEQAAASAKYKPLERTYAHRLCLAYLASRSGPERWQFDQFWAALIQPDDKIRTADLTRCLNAIYLRLGLQRS